MLCVCELNSPSLSSVCIYSFSSKATTMSAILFIACFMMLLFSQASGNHLHRHASKGHHGNEKCSRCPPGWGVTERCTPDADTRCELCPRGTYSPHHSALASCWMCSRCGPGLYEAHPCSRRADTLCDRCATLSGPHNPDYARQCAEKNSSTVSPQPAMELPTPPVAARLDGQHGAEEGAANTTEHGEPQGLGSYTQQDRERGKISGNLALGAVAIASLQTSLLVIVLAAICFFTRRMRTCLRDEDKERGAQEEMLLQQMQPMVPEAEMEQIELLQTAISEP